MDIALIDGDFIMYYCGFGKKVIDEDKIPLKIDNKFVYEEKTWEEVQKEVDSLLKAILRYLKVKWYIGVLTESKCFRYQIYPEYKANRKKLEKPRWFNEIKQYLKEYYQFTDVEGLEADDVVNIYKNKLKGKMSSIIISPDKDLLSLEGKHFDPKNMKYVETDHYDADVKFWSDMIIGQTGDNIKGIPGKGEVFAKTIITFDNYDKYGFPEIVLREYINYFGENYGIIKYANTYSCLKILDDYEKIPDPKPIQYIKEEDIYVQ